MLKERILFCNGVGFSCQGGIEGVVREFQTKLWAVYVNKAKTQMLESENSQLHTRLPWSDLMGNIVNIAVDAFSLHGILSQPCSKNVMCAYLIQWTVQ